MRAWMSRGRIGGRALAVLGLSAALGLSGPVAWADVDPDGDTPVVETPAEDPPAEDPPAEEPPAEPVLPSAVSALRCEALDGGIAVDWSDAVDGVTVDFTVVVTDQATTQQAALDVVTGSASTITGLTPGAGYQVTVAGRDAEGVAGPAQTCTAQVPYRLAAAPTGVSATGGAGSIVVAWAAVTDTGGAVVTGYRIEVVSTSGSRSVEALPSARSTTVTGLTNGQSYQVRVRAVTAAGDGNLSAVVLSTPRTVASAPTSVTATPGNGTVTLAWTAPSLTSGGTTRTGYLVRYTTADGDWVEVMLSDETATSYTIRGLQNGTASRAQVIAVNAAGNGAASSTVQATPRTVPTAPRSVAVKPGNVSIVVTWSAPSSTGGASRTAYVVQYAQSGEAWRTASSTVSASATSYTIRGLTNGSTYSVRVIAVNAAGKGAASTTVSAKPRTVPTSPRSVTATAAKGAIVVRWSAPSSSGGATRTAYVVQYAASGGSWQMASSSVSASATSYTIRGLTNGASYRVRVIAVNAAGKGAASSTPSAKPRTTPSAPRLVTAKPGTGTIVVRWSAPSSSGGATRTAYVVQYAASGGSWQTASSSVSASATSYTIRGLKNGTSYRVRVIAVNAAGKGAASSTASAKTKAAAPSAPRSVSGSATTSVATIRWSAPTSNGGASITAYRVQRYSGGSWSTVRTVSGSARSVTISGLSSGTSYRFRVVAVNSAGSTTSSSVTVTTRKPASSPSGCDPNYSGCVPIASDVDCAGGSGNGPKYVQGPVRVIGRDIYDLDADGDGWGCE